MRRIRVATRAPRAVLTLTLLAALTACGGGDSGGEAGGGDASAETSEASEPAEPTEPTETAEEDFTGQSADEIATASREAMRGLTSLRLDGTVDQDGQQLEIDLAVSTAGDCTGTISLAGASVEVLGVGGEAWIRPSEEFWRKQLGPQADAVIKQVGDKWVPQPAGDKSFQRLCDLDQLLEELVTPDGATYEKGEVSELAGEEVVAIESTDTDGETSTGYVQVGGEHYLVKAESQGDTAGSVTFSAFDEPVGAKAPAAGEVAELPGATG